MEEIETKTDGSLAEETDSQDGYVSPDVLAAQAGKRVEFGKDVSPTPDA